MVERRRGNQQGLRLLPTLALQKGYLSKTRMRFAWALAQPDVLLTGILAERYCHSPIARHLPQADLL